MPHIGEKAAGGQDAGAKQMGNSTEKQLFQKQFSTTPQLLEVSSDPGPPLQPGPGNEHSRWARLRAWIFRQKYKMDPIHWDCPHQCRISGGRALRTWPAMYSSEQLSRSRWVQARRFFRFYIQPWFFGVIFVLVCMYLYMLGNNIATWRTNRMADQQGWNRIGEQWSDPNQPGWPGKHFQTVTFVLPDYGFEIFGIVEGSSYLSWELFVNISLGLLCGMTALAKIIRRDAVGIAEWATIVAVLYAVNCVMHIMTTYPDPWGSMDSCQNPKWHEWGSWIFSRMTTDFCGDLMYSGHTLMWISAAILLRRTMYDWLGWDSMPLTTMTHSQANYDHSVDIIRQLNKEARAAPMVAPTANGNKKLEDGAKQEQQRHQPRRVPLGSAVPLVRQLAILEASKSGGTSGGGIDAQSTAANAVRIAKQLGMPVAIELPREYHAKEEMGSAAIQDGIEKKREFASAASSKPAPSELKFEETEDEPREVRWSVDPEGESTEKTLDALEPPALTDAAPVDAVVIRMPPPTIDDAIAAMEEDGISIAPLSDGAGYKRTPPLSVPSLRLTSVDSIGAQAPITAQGVIPAGYGGVGVGGHYGCREGRVNSYRFPAKARGHSDLPAPEEDDARGHGSNAFFRYRVNMPARERVVMSAAPAPTWVQIHGTATLVGTTLLRAALLAWTMLFLAGVLKIRYHYSCDVLVSALITTLLSCNEKFLQWLVPMLYQPVDARYQDAPPFPFSYEKGNWNERISRLGVGGLI
jgi:hypothetical protein